MYLRPLTGHVPDALPLMESSVPFLRSMTVAALFAFPFTCVAQDAIRIADGPPQPPPPRTWVDKDTGHRVWRLSDENNSGGFYFNVNAYTPDEKQMIYTAPDGIHVLDMETHKTKLLVANPPRVESSVRGEGTVHALVAGHKTNSIFYTQTDPATHVTAVYKADTNTGAIRKLTDLPPKMSIVSVNADETLAAELISWATRRARNMAPTCRLRRGLRVRLLPTTRLRARPRGRTSSPITREP